MRLTCSQKDLAQALSVVSRAVDSNATLAVLNNLLLKAEGKRLYFTGTNLEIAITHWIEADVKNEGEITLPARLFSGYVSYLKDAPLELTVEEGSSVLLKTSDSKTKFKGIPANEFPPIPQVDKESSFTLDTALFKQALRQTVFAASLNSTRPALSGVYFHASKGELRLAATDSYRLSERVLPLPKNTAEFSAILPGRTINEFLGVADLTSAASTEIIFSKSQALFTLGEVRLMSRLIEGQFPHYQQIIPPSFKTKATLSASQLVVALKRINLFARENNNKVIFRSSDKKLLITTDVTQYGEGEVEIGATVEGPACEIALNSQYILDFLSHLEGDEVVFEFGEKISPVKVYFPQKAAFTHIIMPLKI